MKRALLLYALLALGLPSAASAVLPAPTGAVASIDSCWGIRIDWNPLAGADSFQVKRGTTVFYTEDNFFRDTGAPAGVVFYTLAGVDSTGIGATTAPVGFHPVVPDPPATLSASDTSCAFVRLDWSGSSLAVEYRVFRDNVLLATLPPTIFTFNDTTIAGDHVYGVAAGNLCGWSDSTTATGTMLATAEPPATFIASDTSCVTVRLDWSASAGADSYAVFRNGSEIDVVSAGVLSYQDTPLPGEYEYGVRAVNMCGRSAAVTDTGTLSPASVPPATFTASIDSCGFVRLDWSSVPYANVYRVRRDGILLTILPDTVHIDSNATVGPHTYQVRSVGPCGASVWTEVIDGFRPPDAPPAPTGLVASDTSCVAVYLSWTDGPDEEGYRVIRNGTLLALLPADSVEFPDGTAEGGVDQGYRVEAWNSCGAALSDSVTGRLIAAVPDAPVGVSASDDLCDSVAVTWSYPGSEEDLDSFLVFHRVSGGDTTWIRAGAVVVGAGIPLAFGHAQIPGDYDYRVAAMNRCGVSPATGPSTEGGSVPPPPATPPGFTASDALCDHVLLQWIEPADTDSFRVFRDGFLLASFPATVTIYRDTLSPGAHEYGVEAGNPCGWSAAAIDSGTIPPSPTAPLFLTATDTLCGRVDLEWGASSAVDTYVVFRDSIEIAAVLPPAFVWSDTDGPVSHEYMVLAATPCGRSTAVVDSGAARPGAGIPPSFTATDTICGSVDLVWEAAANADSYVVFRDGAEAAVLLAPALSWTDVTAPGSHEYGVAGANDCGRSTAILDSGTALSVAAPPTGLVASTDSCGLVRVEWNAAPHDTAYAVYRDSVFLAETPASTPFYRDTDAVVGANTYWVAALGLCGRSDSISTTGDRPPDAPPAPAAVTATDTVCGAVKIVWTALPGVDSFQVYRDAVWIASTGADTTWSDIPTPGTYLYEVEAVGTCGPGPRTGDGGTLPSDTMPVPAPVTASDTVCGVVRVTWPPVEGATEYRVLRDGAFLASTDTTFFEDGTTVPAISHLYSVVASGFCAVSLESDTARGVRPPDSPPAPGVFTATTDRCDGVFLTWLDGEDEEGYLVFRDSVLIDSVAADGTAYLDTSITPGLAAEYRVAPWNGCTVIPELSAPDSGYAIPPPAAPAGAAADSACGGILLRWTDGPEVDGYLIVRDSVLIDSLGPDVIEYFDGNVQPGEPHVYFIGAFNECAALPAYTDSVKGVRPYDAPQTPTINSITDDLCGGIELRWSRSDFTDDYVVYRNGAPIATIPWTDLFYRDVTASPEELYTYQVAARNWCGPSPRSQAEAGTRPPDAPPAPSNTAASNSSCLFILVTWSDVQKETGYRVYRDGASSPVAELGPNVTEYKDTEVSSGPHSYRIEAWNGCGGNRSDPATGERIQGFPASPSDVAASDDGCSEVTIGWTWPPPDSIDAGPVDSFLVSFRAANSGPNWTRLGVVVGGGSGDYDYVHSPAPGTYDYRVLAFNECGASAETPEAVDTGVRLDVPGVPVPVGATDIEVCGGVPFRLTWSPVEGATGYVVIEEGDGRFDRGNELFFETTKTLPGVFMYRVLAEGPCGEGEESELWTVEVQPAPAPLDGVEASDDLCGAIEIIWSAGSASDVWIEPAGGTRSYMNDMESWIDSLPEGGEREYFLGGWNACGTLAASDTVTGFAYPLTSVPPEAASATDGGCDSVVIEWSYPAGARSTVDSFLVDRVRGFTTNEIARIPAADTLLVVDTTSISGQTYLYRVRALSRCGVSAASSDSGYAVSRPAIPSWAGAPAAACAGDDLTLRWEEITGVSSYEVERNGEPDTTVTETELSFVIDEEGTYVFVVRARNECGLGPPSDPRTVTISDAPTLPADVTLDTTSCDEVVISWAVQSDSVRVYRSGTALPVFTGPGDGRFVDTPDNPVTYVVRSFNGCGESEGEALSVTEIHARPPAPTSVIATDAACDSVIVEWAVPATEAAIDGFQVIRSRNDTTIVVAPSLNGSARRFVDRAGEGTYVYEVVALNGCGSSTGDETSRDDGGFLPATPRSAFDAHSDSIGCAGGSFTLRWGGDGGVLNYRLWETTGGTDRIVALLGGTADSATVLAGGAGTRTFRVQAVGVCGIGDRSDPVSVMTITAPAAPPGLAATTDRCGDVLVTWETPPGAAERYRVERDGTPIASVNGPETSYVDTDVVEGVDYEYTVATENACGLSAAGAAVTGRARAGLAAPVPTGPADGAEGLPIPVLLSWETVEGAAGYALRVEEIDGGATVVDTALENVTEFALSGLALGGDYRWRVATRSPCGTGLPTAWRSFTTFGLAPAALASAPADGHDEVDVDVVIRVTFSAPLDGASIGAAVLTGGGASVAGDRSLENGGSVLVFRPAAPLQYGVTYSFDYSGLEDVFGRSLEDLPPLTFTTKPAERPFGDVDGDYSRNLADVDLASALLLGTADLSDHPMERIDLNGDGRFTVADLVLLAGVIVNEGMSGPAPQTDPLFFEARSLPVDEPGRTRVVLSFAMAEGGGAGSSRSISVAGSPSWGSTRWGSSGMKSKFVTACRGDGSGCS